MDTALCPVETYFMSDGGYDPARCPSCGEGNDCGLERGKSTCWCFAETVDEAAIVKISDKSRDIACLCRSCASGRQNPKKVTRQVEDLLRMRR